MSHRHRGAQMFLPTRAHACVRVRAHGSLVFLALAYLSVGLQSVSQVE